MGKIALIFLAIVVLAISACSNEPPGLNKLLDQQSQSNVDIKEDLKPPSSGDLTKDLEGAHVNGWIALVQETSKSGEWRANINSEFGETFIGTWCCYNEYLDNPGVNEQESQIQVFLSVSSDIAFLIDKEVREQILLYQIIANSPSSSQEEIDKAFYDTKTKVEFSGIVKRVLGESLIVETTDLKIFEQTQ